MLDIWIVVAIGVAVVVVALPLAAIILVSLASLREESVRSLSGDAPGLGQRVARWLLGYHNPYDGGLASRQASESAAGDQTEVRFVHARRSVSDPGQFPAFDQSEPYQIGLDQRERAGV